MDPDKASDRVKALAKPGLWLCCFFGDNEFQWLKPACIVNFEGANEEELKQKGAKAHKVGRRLALSMYDKGRSMQTLSATA